MARHKGQQSCYPVEIVKIEEIFKMHGLSVEALFFRMFI
ncbi:hypothetical protein HNR39_000699 [Glaciimonas immobilis]|uniref:Uncharacterized protein n=1 Tax=Glaciimonas immobilis TaxID=728004 RepID=A0A840RQX9_9BURK|nr:hypothetical protein [Glaciimonas immobilis]